jgi:hypothetical protein
MRIFVSSAMLLISSQQSDFDFAIANNLKEIKLDQE